MRGKQTRSFDFTHATVNSGKCAVQVNMIFGDFTKMCLSAKLAFLWCAVIVGGQQKQQYNGKYCGMLQENKGSLRSYNCFGILYAMDETRLKLNSFTFQQSLFAPGNITFWIGPAVKTGNELIDIAPSGNGVYLEAKQAPIKFFGQPNTPVIIAKKPSAKEVSLIGLGQKNPTLPTQASVIVPTIATTKSDQITTTKLSPVVTFSSDNSFKTVKPFSLDSVALRVPREAASPENQPRPVASFQEQPKPIAEPHKSADPFSEKFQQSDTKINNIAPSSKVVDVVPVAEPASNSSKTKIGGNVNDVNFKINNSTSNFSANSDLNLTIEPKAIEKEKLSDDELTYKLHLPANLFSNVEGEMIRNSSRKVAISILFAFDNTTKDVALITHGTTPTVNTVAFGNLSDSINQTVTASFSINSLSVATNSTRNDTTDSSVATTSLTTHVTGEYLVENRHWKPLLWYSGGDEILLELPTKKRISDYRWLSVYDHTAQQSIATLILPTGKGFFVPAPFSLKGFKPNLRTKEVHSGPIQIIDTKTIRINDFYFEGDAPGAWFMGGQGLFPTLSGSIIPILKDDGTYDCDFLQAYKNQTVILKLPGTMEATDMFWLSVFCVPYSISFAHVFIPYKDLSVPVSMSTDINTPPHCMLEGAG